MPEPIEGIFLSLCAKERETVSEACREMGFEDSGKGVKEMLLSLISEEGAAGPGDGALRFIKENPDKVMEALQAGKNIFSMARKVFGKK